MLELQLLIDARYMITSNLDTSDGLVNGSTRYLKKVDMGYLKSNDTSSNDKPMGVWLQMEEPLSGKKRRIQYKNVTTSRAYPSDWTPLEPITSNFKRGKGSLQVAKSQFPIVVAEALTIHKSQGATYDKVLIDLTKGRVPTRSSLYVHILRQ